MATKLFKESDTWGDSSGNSADIAFSFKKTPKVKKNKKDKNAKKRNHSAIEEDPQAGKYVRAPKYYGLEDSDGAVEESPKESKKNKRKRKHEAIENGNSTDEVTPEKKMKKQQQVPAPVPSSFGDKLRENLKGSRFRFLNEQMYKQSGIESMKLMKEDPTAFEAYHEGYRHQISQWPMNPLDRIINNIKRL
jgi:ribosomal RNA-processing protein 8